MGGLWWVEAEESLGKRAGKRACLPACLLGLGLHDKKCSSGTTLGSRPPAPQNDASKELPT